LRNPPRQTDSERSGIRSPHHPSMIEIPGGPGPSAHAETGGSGSFVSIRQVALSSLVVSSSVITPLVIRPLDGWTIEPARVQAQRLIPRSTVAAVSGVVGRGPVSPPPRGARTLMTGSFPCGWSTWHGEDSSFDLAEHAHTVSFGRSAAHAHVPRGYTPCYMVQMLRHARPAHGGSFYKKRVE
jgi:hypothetical protein